MRGLTDLGCDAHGIEARETIPGRRSPVEALRFSLDLSTAAAEAPHNGGALVRAASAQGQLAAGVGAVDADEARAAELEGCSEEGLLLFAEQPWQQHLLDAVEAAGAAAAIGAATAAAAAAAAMEAHGRQRKDGQQAVQQEAHQQQQEQVVAAAEVKCSSAAPPSAAPDAAVYCCRCCRRRLFYESQVQPHEPKGTLQGAHSQKSAPASCHGALLRKCTSTFVEPMEWMEGLDEQQGKLLCPNPSVRLAAAAAAAVVV
ncbi:hypothetical protein Esti_004625 [Eimeria stiedai]